MTNNEDCNSKDLLQQQTELIKILTTAIENGSFISRQDHETILQLSLENQRLKLLAKEQSEVAVHKLEDLEVKYDGKEEEIVSNVINYIYDQPTVEEKEEEEEEKEEVIVITHKSRIEDSNSRGEGGREESSVPQYTQELYEGIGWLQSSPPLEQIRKTPPNPTKYLDELEPSERDKVVLLDQVEVPDWYEEAKWKGVNLSPLDFEYLRRASEHWYCGYLHLLCHHSNLFILRLLYEAVSKETERVNQADLAGTKLPGLTERSRLYFIKVYLEQSIDYRLFNMTDQVRRESLTLIEEIRNKIPHSTEAFARRVQGFISDFERVGWYRGVQTVYLEELEPFVKRLVPSILRSHAELELPVIPDTSN